MVGNASRRSTWSRPVSERGGVVIGGIPGPCTMTATMDIWCEPASNGRPSPPPEDAGVQAADLGCRFADVGAVSTLLAVAP